jgi:hypothetical protein
MPDVVWSALRNVIQRNSRFALTDRLAVHLDHVRMPIGNGGGGVKTKGRSLDISSAIKGSVVVLNAFFQCLLYARLIAMARVNGDTKYKP